MPTKCTVRDKSFVEPCDALARQVQWGVKGGVKREAWSNFVTKEPTRTFYSLAGVAARGVKPMALNFCPFCGERIDAPFASETETH